MNRREMMTLGAVSLVAPLPVMAGQGETPVMRAYREWVELKARWDAIVSIDLPDDENDAWCDAVYNAADRVVEARSEGPADFIYKLLACTFDGEHEIGDGKKGDQLWAEARALIG